MYNNSSFSFVQLGSHFVPFLLPLKKCVHFENIFEVAAREELIQYLHLLFMTCRYLCIYQCTYIYLLYSICTLCNALQRLMTSAAADCKFLIKKKKYCSITILN